LATAGGKTTVSKNYNPDFTRGDRMAIKVTTRNSAELSNPKRREMLKRVGAAGVAGAAIALPPTERTLAAQPQAPAVQPLREVLETLTAAEARTAHYVDRALTGPLASSKPA